MTFVIMAFHRTDDREPGRLPVVRNDGESTTFEFDAVSPETGERLVIRCDSKGEVWASIAGVGAQAPKDPDR